MSKKDTSSNTINHQAISKNHVNIDMKKIEAQLLPIEDSPDLKDDNEFRSAGVLMKAIADEAWSWRNSLPEGFQPAIVAVLQGGVQIDVLKLSQASFHGIRIEGILAGNSCVMLAHQSSVQVLCYATKIEESSPKRSIGFIWPDKEIEI